MPISETDRRTLIHLGCPRNVEDVTHMLRTDPHSKSRPEKFVADQLRRFVRSGLVVDLGEQQNSLKLGLSAQNHKNTIEFADEQTEIFSRRLAIPTRHWRIEGKAYFLSNAGLEALKQPLGDDRSFNTSELSELINKQRGCVFDGPMSTALKEIDEDAREWLNPHAGQYFQLPILTSKEYSFWVEQVTDHHAKVWGDNALEEVKKKTKHISGGASGWTDAWENQIIDQENQKTRFPALVDPFFICLTILAFTDSDTVTTANNGTHQPTYTGYAPHSTGASAMATASGGSSANNTDLTFAACTGLSSTIVGFANAQGASGANVSGELRKYGTCTSVTVSTTQTPATIASGAYITTAD